MHSHEKELERTSHNIKELIKEVKNLINTAKNLSKAQRSLASHLINFRFDCIGSNQTDDELVIAGSLKEFGRLINTIEVVFNNSDISIVVNTVNLPEIGMLVSKLQHQMAASMIFANCQSAKIVADKHPNAGALCLNDFIIDS